MKGPGRYPVSCEQLAWCKKKIELCKNRGNLMVLADRHKSDIAKWVEALRANHLGTRHVAPAVFQSAALELVHFTLALEFFGTNPHTKIGVIPWRAGLAFMTAFADCSKNKLFYHIGVARDEHTLQSKIYFEEPPRILLENHFHDSDVVEFYIMDPMLATGNTALEIVKRLKHYRIKDQPVTDKMIKVISLFAAPEGIARLLEKHPDLKITTAVLDDHLDARGFIVPGLGDFGDQFFAGRSIHDFAGVVKMGLLSRSAFAALRQCLVAGRKKEVVA